MPAEPLLLGFWPTRSRAGTTMPSPKMHQPVVAERQWGRGGLLDGVRSGDIRRTGSIAGPVVEPGLAVCCFVVVVRASVDHGGLQTSTGKVPRPLSIPKPGLRDFLGAKPRAGQADGDF